LIARKRYADLNIGFYIYIEEDNRTKRDIILLITYYCLLN